jgi:hypothetical protein
MEKVRDILLFFAAIMAVFALICALYQAMNSQVAAATLLSAMFLVCVMVVFLPKLEILEAWGVKAHLVRTLNEADEILAKLRQLSISHAKAMYNSFGIGQRWDGHNAKQNQAILDEIDNQLRDLKVPVEERRALAASYVKLMGFDFYMLFAQTLERYWQSKQQAMRGDSVRNPQNEALKAELEKWRQGLESWQPNYGLFSQLGTYSLEDEINRITPSGWLSDRDQKAVESFHNQILKLYKDTEAKGGLTVEAAEYFDAYQGTAGQDKKIKELFDFNPSEPH